MRTDHCSAARWALAPWAAKRSGWASRCRSFQRLSISDRSCANRCGRPKSSKSLLCRFTLDAETFAAAAAVTFVRVVEAEALVEAFAHEVQLRAVDVGEAFGVHQELDAMVLEHHVLGRHIVDVLELVRQARAARGLDAEAHAHALTPFRKVACHVPRRG